jgi:hypothetical protein
MFILAAFLGGWYGVATKYKGSRFGAHLCGLFAGGLCAALALAMSQT